MRGRALFKPPSVARSDSWSQADDPDLGEEDDLEQQKGSKRVGGIDGGGVAVDFSQPVSAQRVYTGVGGGDVGKSGKTFSGKTKSLRISNLVLVHTGMQTEGEVLLTKQRCNLGPHRRAKMMWVNFMKPLFPTVLCVVVPSVSYLFLPDGEFFLLFLCQPLIGLVIGGILVALHRTFLHLSWPLACAVALAPCCTATLWFFLFNRVEIGKYHEGFWYPHDTFMTGGFAFAASVVPYVFLLFFFRSEEDAGLPENRRSPLNLLRFLMISVIPFLQIMGSLVFGGFLGFVGREGGFLLEPLSCGLYPIVIGLFKLHFSFVSKPWGGLDSDLGETLDALSLMLAAMPFRYVFFDFGAFWVTAVAWMVKFTYKVLVIPVAFWAAIRKWDDIKNAQIESVVEGDSIEEDEGGERGPQEERGGQERTGHSGASRGQGQGGLGQSSRRSSVRSSLRSSADSVVEKGKTFSKKILTFALTKLPEVRQARSVRNMKGLKSESEKIKRRDTTGVGLNSSRIAVDSGPPSVSTTRGNARNPSGVSSACGALSSAGVRHQATGGGALHSRGGAREGDGVEGEEEGAERGEGGGQRPVRLSWRGTGKVEFEASGDRRNSNYRMEDGEEEVGEAPDRDETGVIGPSRSEWMRLSAEHGPDEGLEVGKEKERGREGSERDRQRQDEERGEQRGSGETIPTKSVSQVVKHAELKGLQVTHQPNFIAALGETEFADNMVENVTELGLELLVTFAMEFFIDDPRFVPLELAPSYLNREKLMSIHRGHSWSFITVRLTDLPAVSLSVSSKIDAAGIP
uniref:Uncharacterized protein n=1 Tax=Chromera velia CCMP2878 TaxID=1169474 RepID=A0A0G4GJU4_9ALVE|eukprot:Cvel_22210.t1-p1 / transcript=Cvel_22210.t1 / gene=Cvel_22210 / organism=Chromera_velia_CCMP2878 / gene_product=hypothetical protein / transcript_product=hypothetical protein / location=Cvel_scaffold2158:14029-23084(+) / protein_length=797 / sequence_SO=supercontig / SO=protein_coding / is_pseudo=false